MIRFEILLPLFYNDSRSVEREKFVQTDDELVQRFGATSTDTVVVRGRWVYQSTTYQDQLVRVRLDVEDSPESWGAMREVKQALKARFEQPRYLDHSPSHRNPLRNQQEFVSYDRNQETERAPAGADRAVCQTAGRSQGLVRTRDSSCSRAGRSRRGSTRDAPGRRKSKARPKSSESPHYRKSNSVINPVNAPCRQSTPPPRARASGHLRTSPNVRSSSLRASAAVWIWPARVGRADAASWPRMPAGSGLDQNSLVLAIPAGRHRRVP